MASSDSYPIRSYTLYDVSRVLLVAADRAEYEEVPHEEVDWSLACEEFVFACVAFALSSSAIDPGVLAIAIDFRLPQEVVQNVHRRCLHDFGRWFVSGGWNSDDKYIYFIAPMAHDGDVPSGEVTGRLPTSVLIKYQRLMKQETVLTMNLRGTACTCAHVWRFPCDADGCPFKPTS